MVDVSGYLRADFRCVSVGACPFCGRHNVTVMGEVESVLDAVTSASVVCVECGATGRVVERSAGDNRSNDSFVRSAVNAWNVRESLT